MSRLATLRPNIGPKEEAPDGHVEEYMPHPEYKGPDREHGEVFI